MFLFSRHLSLHLPLSLFASLSLCSPPLFRVLHISRIIVKTLRSDILISMSSRVFRHIMHHAYVNVVLITCKLLVNQTSIEITSRIRKTPCKVR